MEGGAVGHNFGRGAIQESFQQSLVEIGSVVSEEKIFFKFQPIRNKNFPWRPCFLSYQIKCEKLTKDEQQTTVAKWWQKLTWSWRKKLLLEIKESKTYFGGKGGFSFTEPKAFTAITIWLVFLNEGGFLTSSLASLAILCLSFSACLDLFSRKTIEIITIW